MKEHRQLLEQEVEKVIQNVSDKEELNIYSAFLTVLKVELEYSNDGVFSAEKIAECFRLGVEIHKKYEEDNAR